MAKEWPAKTKKCEYCGNKYVYRVPTSRFCSTACRTRYNDEKRKAENKAIDEAFKAKQKEQKQKEEERAKKDKNSLQKKINAARALGMTYGKYVALMEREAK